MSNKAEHLQTAESRRKNWRAATRTGVKGIGFTNSLDGKTNLRSPRVTAIVPKSKGEKGYYIYSWNLSIYPIEHAVRLALNVLHGPLKDVEEEYKTACKNVRTLYRQALTFNRKNKC